jgi:hypothetical protein
LHIPGEVELRFVYIVSISLESESVV